ncbi:PREDICTED: proline-rich protein 2-like [Hipposideros armiger]|uniref:Proline-rich protein 2-like n=1 Tax=Hipposideros armiger TaxID=186990 RepID=A0A8B7SLA9_HIPAR|nr:PREDICTED: proline-rich protein 2-like [Hipposideros armiger]
MCPPWRCHPCPSPRGDREAGETRPFRGESGPGGQPMGPREGEKDQQDPRSTPVGAGSCPNVPSGFTLKIPRTEALAGFHILLPPPPPGGTAEDTEATPTPTGGFSPTLCPDGPPPIPESSGYAQSPECPPQVSAPSDLEYPMTGSGQGLWIRGASGRSDTPRHWLRPWGVRFPRLRHRD